MKTNTNQNDSKKDIEDLARMFASKLPKETTYNNTKSRKYFGSKQSDDNSGVMTIKDTLIHNTNNNSLSTNSKKESLGSQILSNILRII